MKRQFYKQNTLQQLRGFYHVALTGSFTAAAESMCLGQSAVSLQVQSLEREYGVRLFTRRGRGTVALTWEGEVLFELVAPLVEGLESLQETFAGKLDQLISGRVVCAAPESMVLNFLPDVAREFRTRFPNASLVIQAGPFSYAAQMVSRSEADLGIGITDHAPRNIDYRPLISFSAHLVVPEGHPLSSTASVSIEDAVQYPFVAPVEVDPLWSNICRLLESLGLEWPIATRLPNDETRLQYVALGFGVTITYAFQILSRMNPPIVKVPLVEDLPPLVYGLITRKNVRLSVPATKFVDLVIDRAEALQSV
ncbi:MAG: LysR family transcriptional regulator [Chloroflexota bacterium]